MEHPHQLHLGDRRRPVVVLAGDPARGRLPQPLEVVGPHALEPLAPAVVAQVGADRGRPRAAPTPRWCRPRRSRGPRCAGSSTGGPGANTPHCCSEATSRTAVLAWSSTDRCRAEPVGRWVATWARRSSTMAAEMRCDRPSDRSTRSDRLGEPLELRARPRPAPRPRPTVPVAPVASALDRVLALALRLHQLLEGAHLEQRLRRVDVGDRAVRGVGERPGRRPPSPSGRIAEALGEQRP